MNDLMKFMLTILQVQLKQHKLLPIFSLQKPEKIKIFSQKMKFKISKLKRSCKILYKMDSFQSSLFRTKTLLLQSRKLIEGIKPILISYYQVIIQLFYEKKIFLNLKFKSNLRKYLFHSSKSWKGLKIFNYYLLFLRFYCYLFYFLFCHHLEEKMKYHLLQLNFSTLLTFLTFLTFNEF